MEIDDLNPCLVNINSKSRLKSPPLVFASTNDDAGDDDVPLRDSTFNVKHYIIEKKKATCFIENCNSTVPTSCSFECHRDGGCASATSLIETDISVKSSTGSKVKSKSEACLQSPNKHVHFADACGLDLAAVKQINQNSTDDIILPTNATTDEQPEFNFEFLFEQPGCNWQFDDIVRRQHLCLENCFIDKTQSSLSGIVMLNFEDCVGRLYTRYTVDSWENFRDIDCEVVNDDEESNYRYSFSIDLKELIINILSEKKTENSIVSSISEKQEDSLNDKSHISVLANCLPQLMMGESLQNLLLDEYLQPCDYDWIADSHRGIATTISDTDNVFLIIEFAVCLECYNGQSYWDNNNNLNYKLQCKKM